MALIDLCDPKSNTKLPEIAAYLDGLDHATRLAETRTLAPKHQKWLFENAALDITYEHFLPRNLAPLTEVIHHGRNTLPLPEPFRLFQKRFCKPAADATVGFGYNEGSTRAMIGPGYFVLRDSGANAEWQARGAWFVDYFSVPDAAVVPGWPEVKRNNQGLQMFVYQNTRDFMRKVSEHVSIGAAFKNEKALGAYFILCREDQ